MKYIFVILSLVFSLSVRAEEPSETNDSVPQGRSVDVDTALLKEDCCKAKVTKYKVPDNPNDEEKRAAADLGKGPLDNKPNSTK